MNSNNIFKYIYDVFLVNAIKLTILSIIKNTPYVIHIAGIT